MSEPFIAEIRIFAGNFAIRGWAFCDGLLLPISQNTALFAIIGTTYGGDGETTTALPDLRGRLALHPGSGPGLTTKRLGERGGQDGVTLAPSQIASHGHTLSAVAAQADVSIPATATSLGATPGGARAASLYGAAANLVDMAPESLASTGGGGEHNNEQPYLVLNFLIALQGLFPSRN